VKRKNLSLVCQDLEQDPNVLAEERHLKPSLSDEGEEWSTLKGPNYLG
jgi:hypothetical protein